MKLMNESKLKHIGKISIAPKTPYFRKRNACGVLSKGKIHRKNDGSFATIMVLDWEIR